MSSLPIASKASPSQATFLLPVLVGLAAMYVPTFSRLLDTLWKLDEQSHAPLILMASAWLLYDKLSKVLEAPARPALVTGLPGVIFGLLMYVVGRSQNIVLLELSALPVLIGFSLVTLRGWGAARHTLFPLVFMLFAAPLPGFIVDALTGPLKLWISAGAETILHAAGYPIGRDGVALSVGQYRLLVADACSGLNSMFSLSAVGIFYMYLVGKRGQMHNVLLGVSIPVIAFFANLLRVIALCLITYHMGDEAAQGFLHGATGVFLFAVALTMLFIVDTILTGIFGKAKKAS